MQTYSKTYKGLKGTDDHIWWSSSGISSASRSTLYGSNITDNGYYDPDWRIKVQTGQNATTNRTAQRYKALTMLSARHECMHQQTPTLKWTQVSTLQNGLLGSIMGSASTTALDNKALAIFCSKLPSSFKGLTFLGEMRESASMLKRAAKGLFGKCTAFRQEWKGKRVTYYRAQNRFHKDIAEAWLAFSFGVKPLLKDIQQIAETYNAIPKDNVTIARGSATDDELGSYKADLGGLNFVGSRVTSYARIRRRVSYKGAVIDRISGQSASADWGLWQEEFVPTAWELLPYSFLIDYFTNIGEFLDARVTVARHGVSWLSKSIVKRSFTQNILSPYNLSPVYATLSSRLGTSLIQGDYINRVALSTIPLPALCLQAQLSTSRGINVLALVAMRTEDTKYVPRPKPKRS